MSKELDYLDKILKYQPLTLVQRTMIDCIKEKIQCLEALEKLNPSEAIKCLEYLADFNLETDILVGQTKAYGVIKQALIKAQELEEELEDAVIIPRATLERWFELLCVNGCNSKGMVRNDIQEVLKKNEISI